MPRIRPHLPSHETNRNKHPNHAKIASIDRSLGVAAVKSRHKLLQHDRRSPQKPPKRRSDIDASTRRGSQNGRKGRNRDRTHQKIQGDMRSGSYHQLWRHPPGPRISLLLRRRMAQDRRRRTVSAMSPCLHVPALVPGLLYQHLLEMSEGVSPTVSPKPGKDGKDCIGETQRGLGSQTSRLVATRE